MYKINFDELEKKTLRGSERQVKWANSIRERTIRLAKEMYEYLEGVKEERRTVKWEKLYKNRFDNFLLMMKAEESTTWINNQIRFESDLDKLNGPIK
jgi:hypothetical protein